VEKWFFEPEQTLRAPHLLDVEVAQVIRRYAANGEIDDARAARRWPTSRTSPCTSICTTSFCRASGG
jgi:hypothetical protein